MGKEDLPECIQQFWSENPTEYTKEDIYHLEPNGLNGVFLKILALGSSEAEKNPLVTADGFYLVTSDDFKICVRD